MTYISIWISIGARLGIAGENAGTFARLVFFWGGMQKG